MAVFLRAEAHSGSGHADSRAATATDRAGSAAAGFPASRGRPALSVRTRRRHGRHSALRSRRYASASSRDLEPSPREGGDPKGPRPSHQPRLLQEGLRHQEEGFKVGLVRLSLDRLGAQLAVLPRDVPLLVVGGISPDNMAPWRAAGAAGFGLGSGLYKPGRSAAETGERARAYVAGARA